MQGISISFDGLFWYAQLVGFVVSSKTSFPRQYRLFCTCTLCCRGLCCCCCCFSVGAFDAISVSDLLLMLYWTLHVTPQRMILLGSEAVVVVYWCFSFSQLLWLCLLLLLSLLALFQMALLWLSLLLLHPWLFHVAGHLPQQKGELMLMLMIIMIIFTMVIIMVITRLPIWSWTIRCLFCNISTTHLSTFNNCPNLKTTLPKTRH